MFGDIEVTEYTSNDVRKASVHINASWITITVKGVVVFRREPTNLDWYDAKHKAIVDAIRVLENAVNEAIP